MLLSALGTLVGLVLLIMGAMMPLKDGNVSRLSRVLDVSGVLFFIGGIIIGV